MHVLFVSPEVWPLSRVGGLAEVSHDLPLALAARGHTVDVVTPKCRLAPEQEARLKRLELTLEVPVSWRRHHAEVFTMESGPGVTIYLISHEHLFDREGLYGNAYGDYEDNAERFIFFSRAAMELCLALGKPVDLIHANDWTTGLVPLYHKAQYHDHPLLAQAGSLMTVHNMGSQGIFWHYDMPLTGLGWEYFTPEAIEFYGKINFLKAGLVYADMISTVSPTYAQEIQTKEMGYGLEGVIQSRLDRLAVVINGVDYQVWDPRVDTFLAANYGPGNLAGKALCQAGLRQAFGLPAAAGRPLVGFLGRLVERRGMDLLAPALEQVLDLGLDMVIMGFGDDHYHAFLQELHRRRAERLGLAIGYEMDLAHQIIAGCDLLLMPSRYEPCGLHQLHALRYGTLPVVRATGGLADTVSDHTPSSPGVGFKFQAYEAPAMLEALGRALDTFSRPQEWQAAMGRAMALDFSWGKAAAAYEDIYRQARANAQEERKA
ncbi:MAG: glycogen synthase [Desulfarculus sp.]|nr:glycogen synthase [Desulfarculus sp.]